LCTKRGNMAKLTTEEINKIKNKHQELTCLPNLNIKTFVETGTYLGETLGLASHYFDRCFSIELSEKFYNLNVEKFKNSSNIFLHKGSSATELSKIFNNFLHEPVMFFLDAHYSSGGTARDPEYDPPVLIEIDVILKNRITSGFYNDIIIVDDYGQFGSCKQDEDWTEITTSNIEKLVEKYGFRAAVYADNDRLIIHFLEGKK
jgi:hypothetical protein